MIISKQQCLDIIDRIDKEGSYPWKHELNYLRETIGKISSEERNQFYDEFIQMRGVNTPCKKCNGLGTIVYGSTSTWRGGIGGAAMTNGVCNKCWGSGDEHLHWLDLRTSLRPR